LQEQRLPKWLSLMEGAGHSIGWLTTNARKESVRPSFLYPTPALLQDITRKCLFFSFEQMCFQLRDALRVGFIAFSSDFFSLTSTIRETKQRLEDELRNYSVLVEAPKTPFGQVKRTYTGKLGGRNDDLVITLQLALAGLRIFYQVATPHSPAARRSACLSSFCTLLRARACGWQDERYASFRPLVDQPNVNTDKRTTIRE
jgi:hypothetical protein